MFFLAPDTVPSNLKYKKYHRSLVYRKQLSCVTVPTIGGVVLKAQGFGLITAEQLESARRIIRRKLKKKGTILYYSQPFVSLTSKPLTVRMGKGKGAVAFWAIPITPGKLIIHIFGVPVSQAQLALRAGSRKFAFKTIVQKF